MKPREFWIDKYFANIHPVGDHFYGGKDGRTEQPYFHVIEYSAVEQLQAKLDEAVKALETVVDSPENSSDAYGAFKISIRAARQALQKIRGYK